MQKALFRIGIAIFIIFLSISTNAQGPVSWTFSAKKVSDRVYDLHFTANVIPGWHVYSQSSPEGGPDPTKITFNKNPLLAMEGKIKEIGNLIEKFEDVFGVVVKYYEDQVDFVQRVKLKANVKTVANGKLAFMTCDDEKCLPLAEIPFQIQIQ